jgi:hypothetical protein
LWQSLRRRKTSRFGASCPVCKRLKNQKIKPIATKLNGLFAAFVAYETAMAALVARPSFDPPDIAVNKT